MRAKYYYITLCFVVFGMMQSTAQELKATVSISVPKLQTADPSLFKTLESDLEDFINNQRFTDDEYEEHERIECTFSVNITSELDENYFSADIAIQSLRPVFGSDYKTPLITHVDRGVTFQYFQFQQIVDSRNSFTDNLSSAFTFYAYWILAMDYDSFEKNGGTDHFETMQNILTGIAPAAKDRDKGWVSTGKRTTRYWISENYVNPRMSTFRDAMYAYHMEGLDMMQSDANAAKATIMAATKAVGTANRSYPNTGAINVFSASKTDELVEIFKASPANERSQVRGILRNINPAAAAKYNELN